MDYEIQISFWMILYLQRISYTPFCSSIPVRKAPMNREKNFSSKTKDYELQICSWRNLFLVNRSVKLRNINLLELRMDYGLCIFMILEDSKFLENDLEHQPCYEVNLAYDETIKRISSVDVWNSSNFQINQNCNYFQALYIHRYTFIIKRSEKKL